MKYIQLMVINICLASSLFAQSIEPSVIGSAGDFYSNSSAQLSFTFGEMITETVTSANNIITQGFQQPEATNVGIYESEFHQSDLVIYPNPTRNFITLDFKNSNYSGEYQIFDVTGKLLSQSTVYQNLTVINMASFTEGVYFLKIGQYTYRVIKAD